MPPASTRQSRPPLVTEHPPDTSSSTALQNYYAVTGDYSNKPLIARDQGWTERDIQRGPQVESFLVQRIGTLLSLPGTDPVTYLEVGCGAAKTPLEIIDTYPDAVDEGRLAVVVTNLRKRVPDFVAALPEDSGKRTRELYNTHADRVHEIFTDFTPGPISSIELPTGPYNLSGRVDIVNENLSLTAWGHDLPNQIEGLGRYLSPRFMYMVPLRDIEFGSTLYRRDTAPITAVHNRLLTERCGTSGSNVEDGAYKEAITRYVFLKGPDALPIKAD